MFALPEFMKRLRPGDTTGNIKEDVVTKVNKNRDRLDAAVQLEVPPQYFQINHSHIITGFGGEAESVESLLTEEIARVRNIVRADMKKNYLHRLDLMYMQKAMEMLTCHEYNQLSDLNMVDVVEGVTELDEAHVVGVALRVLIANCQRSIQERSEE